jgi:hypothetical protein
MFLSACPPSVAGNLKIAHYLLAGTEGANYAYMFARSGSNWILEKQLKASDHVNTADFGWSVSVSGEYSIVGAYSDWRDTSGGNTLSHAGAAYIFGRTSGTDVEQSDVASPCEFRLDQNYPNPFNPSTTIEFTVETRCNVSLRIFDLLGREVATLVNGERKAGVLYKETFDASRLASGLYLYRLQTEKNSLTKKLMLMK